MPEPSPISAQPDVEVVEVVVVGAGLSGLIAARDLARAGVDVVVFEAADRVGGRSMSESTEVGSRVDIGGQWLGHDHHRARALAKDLELQVFPMHTGFVPTLTEGGRKFGVATPSTIIAGAALGAMALLARFGTPGRLDAVSVQAALAKVPGRRARRLLEVIALISWTGDLERLSLSSAAELIRRQGGVRTMISTKGGAQESLVAEGAGTMAELIAAELGPRVRLGQPVVGLHRGEPGVTVRLANESVRAAAVVVSLPAPMAGRIEYDPPLPAAHAATQEHSFMGTVYKAIAVYERPWWRDSGSAELMMLDGPGCAAFDSSPPDGPGHLTILIGGPAALALDALNDADRRKAVLGPIARILGSEVQQPASWHEKAWHLDEHVGGGYVALPDLAAGREFWPTPHTAVGRLHWAGSETADDHPGYLDGAIEAGQRAASEVIAQLR